MTIRGDRQKNAPPSRVRHRLTAAALLALAACVTACAANPSVDESQSAGVAGNPAALPAVAAVASIAEQVPGKIRTTGVLHVATSATLPPMTYVADDNRTLIGLDIDVAKAVAATMGLRAELTNAGFDTLVPGLQSGRFDMVVSSMGVTAERQRVVDFVDYYNGGQGFLASANTGFAVNDLIDLCGRRVAVTTGSTQQSTLQDSQHICTDAGRPPYQLQAFPDTNGAVLAISGNRVDVMYSSISIVSYTAGQNHAFRVAGRYKRAMVGAALPKGTPLTQAVQQSVQHLIDDGTYKRILDKWTLADNAVQTARVNSARTS